MHTNNEQKLIIELVKSGLTNIEIAEELGYSPSTIKKKLCVIYRLFNVRGRMALISKILNYS